MLFKKSAFLVAFLFVFGCVLSVPRCSLAAVPGGHPASGPGWMPEDKGEAVSKEAYEKDTVGEGVYGDRGPAWARDEHPGLKGLRRAYANVCQNGASIVAQNVLKRLIEARSVTDSIYELEEATGNGGPLEEITRDEEVQEALIQEAKRVREEARQQFREQKALARALEKIGRTLNRIGDRIAAEETLVEAAAVAPEDQAVYDALNELYKRMGSTEMPVFIKGKKIEFDVPPRIVDGRTLVPLRKFAESLGCAVEWDPVNRQVVFIQGTKAIVLGVGKATASVDGREVGLDVPPVIINGRTLVPLRFVSEAVNARVGYHAASSMVVVN